MKFLQMFGTSPQFSVYLLPEGYACDLALQKSKNFTA